MKNKSSPERYFYVSLICLILLFLNFYRTDSWTGDKPFSEFVQRDWQLFAIFLIEEIIIVCVMVTFFILGKRKIKHQYSLLAAQLEKDKYLGIKPGDYDYVWFDFLNEKRALILKQENRYLLYVQEYNYHTRTWINLSNVSVYDGLENIKIALFYDYSFYCEENDELDEHKVEFQTGEVTIPINSIVNITQNEITCLDSQGHLIKIDISDAYKQWCKTHHIKKSKQKFVCDRTNIDGQRMMIFYTNPRILIVSKKEQENLWFEAINKMSSYGYFSFDKD